MKKQDSAAKMAAPHTGGSRSCATIAKCADFLAGRYGNLTTEEIEEFREAQADPNGSKWELEHAGEVFGMDAIDLNGFLFVEMPSGETLEESLAHLRRIVGARTITPDRLWWIARHVLGKKEVKRQECRFPEVQPIGEAALSPLLPAEKEMNHDR